MDFSSVLGLSVLKHQLFTKILCHFDAQSFLVHTVQLTMSQRSRHACKYLENVCVSKLFRCF